MQFVNEAIDESKVTLDPLTSGNFASPPRTAMYNRFKNWVNRGYKELAQTRPEWQFRTERATVTLYPRLLLAGFTAPPVIGELWQGVSSGVQFYIREIQTFEDVEDDGTQDYTVGVEFLDGSIMSNLIFREDVVHEAVPDKFAYLKGSGRYSFKNLVTGLQDIDPATAEISKLPTDDDPGEQHKLMYMPYEKWAVQYEYDNWTTGIPQYITETSTGTYDFYPKPDEAMILAFDFTRKARQMVAYNDTALDIPEEYEDYILWAAVMEYADFDNNVKVGARAKKKLEQYQYWLERDYLEKPRIEGSRFYGD